MMENKKIEVYGWFREKVLRSFVDTAKGFIHAKKLKIIISESTSLSSTEKEKIQFFVDETNADLWAALHNSIKIMACLNEPVECNTGNDADEIFDKEEEGIGNILIKHGCSEDLSWLGLCGISTEEKAKEKEKENLLLSEIKSTVLNSSREVRTEIFNNLWKLRHIPTVKLILDLLEPVTNGEKDWKFFQDEVRVLLNDLETE